MLAWFWFVVSTWGKPVIIMILTHGLALSFSRRTGDWGLNIVPHSVGVVGWDERWAGQGGFEGAQRLLLHQGVWSLLVRGYWVGTVSSHCRSGEVGWLEGLLLIGSSLGLGLSPYRHGQHYQVSMPAYVTQSLWFQIPALPLAGWRVWAKRLTFVQCR